MLAGVLRCGEVRGWYWKREGDVGILGHYLGVAGQGDMVVGDELLRRRR